jgi:hypothetical protein
MKKLRNALAAALLVPVLALNANTLTADDAPVGLNPTKPVADWCWIFAGGRWWQVPC